MLHESPEVRGRRLPAPLVSSVGAIGLLLSVSTLLCCEEKPFWCVQGYLGSAYSLPATLTIHQSGEPEIVHDGRYASKPFEGSPYYAYRISRWSQQRAWEIEMVHHKVYLENTTAEIQHFEISHGFNMILVNHAWSTRHIILRAGGGVVVTHTESRIRGQSHDSGYDLSGVAFQGAVEKRYDFTRWLFGSLEGKVSVARVSCEVADGSAQLTNVAFHGLVGVGLRF